MDVAYILKNHLSLLKEKDFRVGTKSPKYLTEQRIKYEMMALAARPFLVQQDLRYLRVFHQIEGLILPCQGKVNYIL